MIGRVQVVTPAAPLVSTETAKQWLRVVDSSEDAVVSLLVASATQDLETRLGLALAPRTVDVWFHGWPDDEQLELPAPLRSVTSITYYDEDDTAIVWSASSYRVNSVGLTPFVWPVSDWPSATLRDFNGVVVRCEVGYESAAAVPSDFVIDLLGIVASTWINRDGLDISATRLLERIDLALGGRGAGGF